MSEAKQEDINSSLPLPYEDDGTDYWQGHLDSWVQSGLSQAAYCRRHDLEYGRFRKWKERLSTYPKHSSIKLVEVKRDFSFNASPQFQWDRDKKIGSGKLFYLSYFFIIFLFFAWHRFFDFSLPPEAYQWFTYISVYQCT